MDDLKEYVVGLFSRCKNPVKQVELICELTGHEMGTVLGILRDAGRVPKNVTVKNYKKSVKQAHSAGDHRRAAASSDRQQQCIGDIGAPIRCAGGDGAEDPQGGL